MSQTNASYLSLNALTRFKKPDGSYHFDSDKEAVRRYLEEQAASRGRQLPPSCFQAPSVSP